MAAKKKTEMVEEEVEVVEETAEETKPKKTTKKETVEEETEKDKLLKQAQEVREHQATQMKLYCKINTPYLAEPNINRNIAGMFPAGTILYVEKTLNNGINGSFYQINDKTFINQKWDVEVF